MPPLTIRIPFPLASPTMADSVHPTEPLLRLPHCVLRPYHISDREPMRAAADDPRVVRYMRDGFPHPYTDADALAWLRICRAEGLEPDPEDQNEGEQTEKEDDKKKPCPDLYLVIGLPDGALAGGIGLRAMSGDGTDRHCREIGYWIAPAYWGRGLATEAAAGLGRWALSPASACLTSDGQPLRRVEAGVFGGNTASTRVLTRAGFVREGVRRQAATKQGIAEDVIVFGLVPEDLEPDAQTGTA